MRHNGSRDAIEPSRPGRLRAVLVDDPDAGGEAIVRLDEALGPAWDLTMVTAFDAVNAGVEAAPDLVLFEPLAAGGGDLAALDRLRARYPTTRVAAFSWRNGPFDARRLLRTGLHGYLLKETEPPVLRAAIELILAGGVYLPPCLLGEPSEDAAAGRDDGVTRGRDAVPFRGSVYRRILYPDGRMAYDYLWMIAPQAFAVDEETLKREPERFFAAMHPADRPVFRASLLASARDLSPHCVEFRLADPSGRYHWYRTTGRPSRGDGGAVVWDGYCVEIGPVERGPAIQSREGRLRDLLDRTSQLIGLLSPEGLLLEVNQAALDFGGLSYTGVIGKPFWETRWWDLSERHRAELRAAVARAAGGELVRYKADMRGRGDRVVAAEFSLKPVVDDTGRVTFLIAEGRDITSLPADRPAAGIEDRLAASGHRLATIVANLPGAIFRCTVGQDGTPLFLYYSARLAEIDGRTPEEVLANPEATFARIHPDDLPHYRAAIEESHRALRRLSQVVRVIQPAGEVRWLRIIGQPWRTPEGDVIIDGLVIDVTEKREAEERLRESERRLAAVAANLPGVIYRAVVRPGHKLRFTYMSPDAARFIGITADEAMADWERFIARIHPDDPERYRRAVDDRITNPAAPDHEYRIVRPDGAVRWFRNVATTWRCPDGQVVIDGIVLDITEQREAEARFRDREYLLTTLTDNLPAVVLRCVRGPDGSSRCTFVAGALDKLTGLAAEGLLNRSTPLSSRVHPDDKAAYLAAYHRAAAHLTELDHEYRFIKPDGEVRWLRWIGRPTPGQDGEVFIDGVIFDVTARRQAVEELDRRNRDLVSLCRISEIALKSPNLDAGLRDIVDEIGRFTGFDLVSVGLYDEAQQVIQYRQNKDLDQDRFSPPRTVSLDRSVAADVVRYGRIVIEHRCLERNEPHLTQMHRLGRQTFFGVPIRIGHRVIGCFTLIAREHVEVEPHLVELALSWADYIASFIASQGAEEVPALLAPERRSEAFEAAFSRLTPRQRDVLAELATGKSNKDIAAALGLQEATVKIHLRAIFKALGATNRTQAATIANAIDHVDRRLKRA